MDTLTSIPASFIKDFSSLHVADLTTDEHTLLVDYIALTRLRCLGNSMSLSPISFALSGDITLRTSSLCNPIAEVKTLSSERVALMKILL